MKLTKIHIESFGKLQNFDLLPQEGLNRLEYPNGWGKTTLANFLCAMLYGLPGTRSATRKNLRQQYTPWQGGAYGGYIELSSVLGDFRIERSFDPLSTTRDELLVIDKSSGRPTTLLGEVPGETLLGVNVEGFEKSVYLTQKEVEVTPGAISSIADRLHKLLDNVEDAGSYDRAVKLIDRAKRDLRGGGVRLQQLEIRYTDLRREIERLVKQQADLKALEAERDACQKELADLEADKDSYHKRRELAAHLEERKRLTSEISRNKAEIAELKQIFRAKLPSEEEFKNVDVACKNLQSAASYASTLENAFPKAEYDTLIRRYPAGIPDESAIARAEELASKRKATEEKLKAITKRKEGAKQSLIPALLPAILSLMAACGALAGILLGEPALAIPFLAVGILLPFDIIRSDAVIADVFRYSRCIEGILREKCRVGFRQAVDAQMLEVGEAATQESLDELLHRLCIQLVGSAALTGEHVEWTLGPAGNSLAANLHLRELTDARSVILVEADLLVGVRHAVDFVQLLIREVDRKPVCIGGIARCPVVLDSIRQGAGEFFAGACIEKRCEVHQIHLVDALAPREFFAASAGGGHLLVFAVLDLAAGIFCEGAEFLRERL